jgi:ATP phosphoribosyltransferase
VLKLVLPKGSLEQATLELFEAADLPVKRGSSRDYHGTIDDPRVERVSLLRPQEIPIYVQEGFFDLGITGRDWIEETGASVLTLGELRYSKRTANPIRVVLAVHHDLGVTGPEQLQPGLKVSTELPNLTRRYFERLGLDARIFPSHGATEAKVPEIVDAVVDLTETGSTLRSNGMVIIDELLTSYTEVVANHAAAGDGGRRHPPPGRHGGTGQVPDQAQRRRRGPGQGAGGAAGDEGADRERAGRLRLSRGRGRGRQGIGEPPDPDAQGRRRLRHHRAGDLQDRALILREM